MRKPKPLPYKRGDEVIYIQTDYGLRITRGTVTAVRNDKGIIYVQSTGYHGTIWKTAFGRECGHFQRDPRPIWQLQPLNGQNVKLLERKAEKCNKRHRAYEEAYAIMQRDVEDESRAWQREEVFRRGNLIPDGPKFVENVIARMGFKKPKVQRFNF